MGILIPILLMLFTCLIIWRACDSFEVASKYIGRNLCDGVRGGTINAVSSSVPELFTTLIALFVLSDKDGFSVGLGTTAGSALFNILIIPAVCILVVVGRLVMGAKVNSVKVHTRVIWRDGLSLIFCEVVLIVLINGNSLHWWQGLSLMGLYGAYLALLLLSMRKDESPANEILQNDVACETIPPSTGRKVLSRLFYWITMGPLLDLKALFVGEKQRQQIAAQTWNGWPLLLTATAVIGAACWMLVMACEWLGTGPGNEMESYRLCGYELVGLGMPTMFVAVIFAAMATSVPDTIMSIQDARDGDYDDSVANALGSNVFDICFALGFPLFLYTLIHGPIEMSADVVRQSGELRLLLLFVTIVGFVIYLSGSRVETSTGISCVPMKRGKALLLIGFYLLFVIYIVGLSVKAVWAERFSDVLQSWLAWFS